MIQLIVLLFVTSGCIAQTCNLQTDRLNNKKIFSGVIVSGSDDEAVKISFVKDSDVVYMAIKFSEKSKEINSEEIGLTFETKKIQKWNAKVSLFADYNYLDRTEQSAFFTLTIEDLLLLSQTPLYGCTVNRFDRFLSEAAQMRIMEAANCLLEISAK